MSLSANEEFISVCMEANNLMKEVDKVYNMYEFALDKSELRKNSDVMEFLSLYNYELYKELNESLYGGKKKKTPRKRRTTKNKTSKKSK